MTTQEKNLRAAEVFTPNKLPSVTYVDAHLKDRSTSLQDALETGAAVISLSGPSKSGKTVFVEKNIGIENLIQITGAGITDAKAVWDRVFAKAGLQLKTTKKKTKGFEGAVSGKIGAGVEIIASATGEISTEGKWSNSNEEETEHINDYLKIIVENFSNTPKVIFIDDFHYIPKSVQTEISNEIKEAIRQNFKFVVASVPYHSDDAIRANPDLRGRSAKIDFNYWAEEELKEIANKGFAALKIEISDVHIRALAKEAAGSPQLMQSLCLNTCFENGVRERQQDKIKIIHSLPMMTKVCLKVANTSDYSSTVAKMAEGPKTRGKDRKTYSLTDGKKIVVYPLILKAIASNPPELTLRYANLKSRINSLCKAETPSGSSITSACAHIASIANKSEKINILEWDHKDQVLDIGDPYLLFYLRWGSQ